MQVVTGNVVHVDGETLHVPPLREDRPIAYKLLRTTSGGKRMWHAPVVAWAYYVIRMCEGAQTRQIDLARNGGRSAQGTPGEYLKIMDAMLPEHRDVVVHWLSTAEECRSRARGSKASRWPVSKEQMLEVIDKGKHRTPQDRERAYWRLANNERRTRKNVGRPAS